MLMQKLREKTKVILWIVTIAFLGWILLDLGMDIVGKRIAKPYEQGFIAEVDGVRIPYDFYRDIMYQMLQDSSKLRGELTDFQERMIEKEAWFRVIEEIRLRKFIEKRNLFLDDSTVFFLLMNYPPPQVYNDTFFRKGDTFDIQKYREFMLDPSNYNFAVQYEKLIRETFPKELMRFDLMTLIHLGQNEIIDNLKKNLTSYNLEYIVLDPASYSMSEADINEQELLDYYNSHQDDFKQTPMINLQMAIFWKRPSKEDTMSKIEEAETVREVILGGTSFEEAAESYASSDTLRKTAGEMGWFSTNEFTKELKNVIDTLKGVSKPLVWRGRVYLFKVEKRKSNRVFLRGIDFVIKTGETTKAEIRNKATDFERIAKKFGFEKAADSMKIDIKETGLYPVTLKFIPFIGENEDVWRFVQDAKEGDISNLFWTPNYFVLCKVKERKEGGIKEFDKVKSIVKNRVLMQRKKEKLKVEAESLRKEWLSKGKVELKGKSYAYYREIKSFKPGQKLYGIPNTNEIMGVVENLKEGQINRPLEVDNKFILIKLVSKSLPDDKDIQKMLQQYAQNISGYRFNQLWNAWKEELRNTRNIKDYRPYLLY